MKKVSILTMTAGAGHNTAARALQGAMGPASEGVAVELIDAANMGTRLVKTFYNDNYLKLVNKSPALWGYMYHRYDKVLSRTKARIKSLFRKLNSRPLLKHLTERDPDICLCTHFYTAELALSLRAKGRIRSRVFTVLTDFQPHAFWVLPEVDRYFVAEDETRHNLAARGIPAERITVTGIPVDLKFAERRDREIVATKLGIDPGRFTVLVASGGMGVGPMEEVVQTILGLPGALTVVAICGKNEKLHARLKCLAVSPEKSLVVNGFVTNMEEWMAAADLLVSKCGGLTTAESLASGLPMLILNPIPGQEAQNCDFLLERGLALKATDLGALAYKLRSVQADPGSLARMRERILQAARPRAAATIARQTLEALGS